MHFVIDTTKWLRNRSKDPNRPKGYRYPGGKLLNAVGNMCCLGFCLLQKGVTPSDIKGLEMPSQVADNLDKSIPGFSLVSQYGRGSSYTDSELSQAAADINDSIDSELATDEQKIEALTKLFKKHRHTIEFIN